MFFHVFFHVTGDGRDQRDQGHFHRDGHPASEGTAVLSELTDLYGES